MENSSIWTISLQAKMDNQVLGYKDLAAIPKDKAILDIERPDLMIYEPHFTYSLLEHVELPRSREVRRDHLCRPERQFFLEADTDYAQE